ncbi:hypothetical protein ACF0H5_017434 [Mactra antiquata]
MFMLSLLICVALTASPVFSEELNAETLAGFQGVFYQTIGQHLVAEQELLRPALERQNETMKECREQITVREEQCTSCAQRSCDRSSSSSVGNSFGGLNEWFVNAGNSFVDWQGWQEVGGFFEDVGDWFSDTFTSIGSGFGDFLGGMPNTFSNTFSDIGNAFSSTWNGFTNFMGDIGSGIGNAFSDVGNFFGDTFGGLFGRKRREIKNTLKMSARRFSMIRKKYMSKRMEQISPEARQCMERCSQCTPFLGDQTAIIAGVCGDQVMLDQANMRSTLMDMENLHNANGHPHFGTTPILSKVEYSPTDFQASTTSFGNVYVTAVTPSGIVRYRSNYRYRLQNPQVSAVEMAEELIQRWGL